MNRMQARAAAILVAGVTFLAPGQSLLAGVDSDWWNSNLPGKPDSQDPASMG